MRKRGALFSGRLQFGDGVDDSVPFRVTLGRRGGFVLRFGARGISVRAPRRVCREEVRALFLQRADWIQKTAQKWRERENCRFQIREGASIPYLGEFFRLTRSESGECYCDGAARALYIAAPEGEDAFRSAFVRWLRQEAREYFAEQIQVYVNALKVPPPSLRISGAESRWGSCNTRREIRLSWRLLYLAPAQIAYVVAHECAHLLEMNHGPMFWKIVSGLYPDWKAARAEIRRVESVLPRISGRGTRKTLPPPSASGNLGGLKSRFQSVQGFGAAESTPLFFLAQKTAFGELIKIPSRR
ncbi:MAG: M48 family metallopeptidase [Zoogloeaceae bacterium]|jgi:predicted metal-dependent hydrolase|nr:M48 family metallopeptidase [Zoogloeaceae bacterium]